MPKLIIDDLEIEVPAGTKVIEAAERLGIIIPRFCYHKALGSVGACRMCAVKFLEGQFKGVQMSCMIDAQDGMVVSTTDEEAVDFRKHVIEWLMMNHPHDCPVCDEGGHCLLQDMTVSGGHGIRRFPGKKRTYRDQYLGELIQHEMNRCIQCYRCVRFYQEFTGYRDLGVMQIANKVYYGRFTDGSLESPFSGNLVDVCPTGVYTDKPARYRARRWDLDRSPTLCIHCSLGCSTVAGARYREVLRQEADFNEMVNGYFICDRGRYGFAYASHQQRPRHPQVGSEEVGWKDALQFAAERLAPMDAEKIACLGSVRSSVETHAILNHLAKSQQWPHPVTFSDNARKHKVADAIARLDDRTALSMRDIETMDFVLAVGVDPINEAPMLALAMRQARRKGGMVVVIDPRLIFLPFDFEHLAVPMQGINSCLCTLVKGIVSREHAANLGAAALQMYDAMPFSYAPDLGIQDQISKLFSRLESSSSIAVVCGTDIVPETTPALAADLAEMLSDAKRKGGLFYTLPGANAFGAAMLGSPEQNQSLEDVIGGIEEGKIKALLVVENDPFTHFSDRRRLEKAFEKLDLLLVLDYLPSETAARADIFFPTRTVFETDSSFINQEGRLQRAGPVHEPGTPIWQVSGGGHPPRRYGLGVPGGELKPAWEVLGDLLGKLASSGKSPCSDAPWEIIRADYPFFGELQGLDKSPYGKRVLPDRSDTVFFETYQPGEDAAEADDLNLLLVEWTFGTEELCGYSETIRKVESDPFLLMHAEDAKKVGLSNGDFVSIELDGDSLQIDLRVSRTMARGTAVLPRHHRLEWQKIGGLAVRLSPKQIKRMVRSTELVEN